nr:hypothetical protein [Halogeometricum pallidum]
MLVIAVYYDGALTDGETALQPLREIGKPIADAIGPHPYAGWQQGFDGLLTPGSRNYWKSHNFAEFTDGMINTFVTYGESLPTPESESAIA